MTSHAVSGLPFGFLTISPAEYSAPVDGAVVTLVICGVVFPVPELPVQAVINTHAIMRNSSTEMMGVFLFIVLNGQGEYLKIVLFAEWYFTLNKTESSQKSEGSLC